MITLKSVHVKNFRSVRDETIELSDFNFFVGKNDCGKSNILKALNLFFNGKTDYDTPFDFSNDYSRFARRGKKQAKEITISVEIIVPGTYKETGLKTWTKIWRSEGLHADNLSELFEGGSKGITLFNRIKYIYIPAIKSKEYFKFLLSDVYSSMTTTVNSTLRDINRTYSKQLQQMTKDLSVQLKHTLHMDSAIQMPKDLDVLFRDLTFSTSDDFVKSIDLNQRGDGIKARHIPSIIRYMQKNLEENKLRGAIDYSFIWGFEEPENGIEYSACFELAEELYSYRTSCQLLITTHSPAFYVKRECSNAYCYYVYKGNDGLSQYDKDVNQDEISEQIGFMPLIAPYIKNEQARYNNLQTAFAQQLEETKKRYEHMTNKLIIITEGKTDIKHIQNAFNQLSLDPIILPRIVYYDFGDKQTLGEELGKLISHLALIPHYANKYIAIFDRDKHIQENDAGKTFKSLGNNVYRFNIPALNNIERKLEDKICIEHYYSNAEIRKDIGIGHLYMGEDFKELGVSYDGHWIIPNKEKNTEMTPDFIIDRGYKHLSKIKTEAKMATKNEFADYVCEHPTEFCYTNFAKIFSIVKQIAEAVENE